MNGRPDLRTLLEVQEALGLPSPALVEKDWHAVRALEAIHDVSTDGMTLAFGGGTALAKAHRLLERMSEDLDFRIVGYEDKRRTELKRVRRKVTAQLKAKGFVFDETKHVTVQHSDTYVRYDIPYDPIASGEGVLRPAIKIELAAFPLRRDPLKKSVGSFLSEALKNDPEIPSVACVQIVETAADKFVALARRSGERYASQKQPDSTLVRHIYDLRRLEGAYDPDDALGLALETMQFEAERGYAAYRDDPIGESLTVLARLVSDEAVMRGYEKLLADMVFGEKPPFDAAISVIKDFAARLQAGS